MTKLKSLQDREITCHNSGYVTCNMCFVFRLRQFARKTDAQYINLKRRAGCKL